LLFPKQIKDQREYLGLTQQRFAELLGVAQTTISRWETGSQIQQRSLDNWMRAFFAFPDLRLALMFNQLPDMGFVGASAAKRHG
jgi:transcriptional regulator with XRE-family HTH domain